MSAAKAMLRYLYSGRCIVTDRAQMSEVRLLLEGLGVEPPVVLGQLHFVASLEETTREAEVEEREAVVKQEAAEDCVSLAVERRIEEENTRLSKQVLELMENPHQEFPCTECVSLLNKENLIEHYKSHISEVSAKVIEDLKRCHGGSVEKDLSPSNESKESKLLLKSFEETPHSTPKPQFTVKPGIKKIYRAKRNVQKPKCFFSYNCSLCDKDISNKLDFLLHFTTKHFPREIRERFPYQAGVRCEPCIEKRQKLFIPKNALHHAKHVGVIHEQVAEFLTEEDRKAMEKFQPQAVNNPNQVNSKKLTQKSIISKMPRLQPTKVLTKRLQVNLTNLNSRGPTLGSEKKLLTEAKKRRAVEKPMLEQKSVVGVNSDREKAVTMVTSVMSDKAGSSTGERCQDQGSPAEGAEDVEDGAVLRVPDPAQPFPCFLRSLCSQAQLVVVGLGREENQQHSTATLHRWRALYANYRVFR